MVQLRLSVKIPNDSDGDETSFLIVLPVPEDVDLEKLSSLISGKWAKLRPEAQPLGIKKLLDDAHPDHDLDVDLTVADVFVDHGKAHADGHDQRAVVRVVQKPIASHEDWVAPASQQHQQHSPNAKKYEYSSYDTSEPEVGLDQKPSAFPEARDSEQQVALASAFSEEEDEYMGGSDRPPREMSLELGGDEPPPKKSLIGQSVEPLKNGNKATTASKNPERSTRQFRATTSAATQGKTSSRRNTMSILDRVAGSQDVAPSAATATAAAESSSSHAAKKRRWSNFDSAPIVVDDDDDIPTTNNASSAKRQKTAQEPAKRRTRRSTAATHHAKSAAPDNETNNETSAKKNTSSSAAKNHGGTIESIDFDNLFVYDLTELDGLPDGVENEAEAPAAEATSPQAVRLDGDDVVMEAEKKKDAKDAKPVKPTSLKRSTLDLDSDAGLMDIDSIHHHYDTYGNNNATNDSTEQQEFVDAADKKSTRSGAKRESERRKNNNDQATHTGNDAKSTENRSDAKSAKDNASESAAHVAGPGPGPGQMGLGITGSPHRAKIREKAAQEDSSPLKGKEKEKSPQKQKQKQSDPKPASVISPPVLPSNPGSSDTNGKKKTSTTTETPTTGTRNATGKKTSGRSRDKPRKSNMCQMLEAGEDPECYIAASNSSFPPHVNKDWLDTHRVEHEWDKAIEAAKEEGRRSREINLMEAVLAKLKPYHLSKRVGQKYKASRLKKVVDEAQNRLEEYRASNNGDGDANDADEAEKKASPNDDAKQEQPRNLRQSKLTASAASAATDAVDSDKANRKHPTPMATPTQQKKDPAHSKPNNSNAAKESSPAGSSSSSSSSSSASSESQSQSQSKSKSESELKMAPTATAPVPVPGPVNITAAKETKETVSSQKSAPSNSSGRENDKQKTASAPIRRDIANNNLVDTDADSDSDDDNSSESEGQSTVRPFTKSAKGKSPAPAPAPAAPAPSAPSDASYNNDGQSEYDKSDAKKRRQTTKTAKAKAPAPSTPNKANNSRAKSVGVSKSASADRRANTSTSRSAPRRQDLGLGTLSQPEPRNHMSSVMPWASSSPSSQKNRTDGNKSGGSGTQGRGDTLKSMKGQQWPGFFSMFSKGDKNKDAGGDGKRDRA